MEKVNTYSEKIVDLVVSFAPKVLMAVAIVLIGWFIVRQIAKVVRKSLGKSKVNRELQPFIISFISIGLKIILITVAAGVVGIETASFAALIAAAGFAIGLAMQGNLSNFAAGILILFFRPFRIGDEVKIQGYWAFIKEIQIFHTVLKRFDQTEVIIPNSVLMNGTIHNLSSTPTRSITLLIKIPFGEDIDRVMEVLKDAVYSIPEVDKTSDPFFWITDFESHSMQMSAGFSTSQEGYWVTDYKVRKAVIDAFVKHKIKVSYPTGVAFGEFGESRDLEKKN